MLDEKPHTLTIFEQDAAIDPDTKVRQVVVTDPVPAVTLCGYLVPLTSEAAFKYWGVELRRPHDFFVDVCDVPAVHAGMVAEQGNRKFAVAAEPITMEFGTECDHGRILLEERQI